MLVQEMVKNDVDRISKRDDFAGEIDRTSMPKMAVQEA